MVWPLSASEADGARAAPPAPLRPAHLCSVTQPGPSPQPPPPADTLKVCACADVCRCAQVHAQECVHMFTSVQACVIVCQRKNVCDCV